MYNVLVLYTGHSMFTPTVQDYLDAFRRYSANNIHYMHVDHLAKPAFSFDDYDVLILTYSCRLCYLELMSPHIRSAIAAFNGLKVAFPQDEYQETNKLKDGIRELGVKLVFTCVPEDKIAWVYPPKELPGVRFRTVLTGYVPVHLARMPRHTLPPSETRKIWIGHRGRNLGHRFGDLGFYKSEIGYVFQSACERRKIPHDIAWTEETRIYQDKWPAFVSSCRATLGSPSGSNIFDWDGSIEREWRELMKKHPDMTYQEYRPRIAEKEREIDMGQVSPRLFEAAALGTVLILLEGSYSDVVRPGEDCLIVKQDFSNIDDVLDRLSDGKAMAAMADRAYDNIIASGKWSYDKFLALVDEEIGATLRGTKAKPRLKASDQSLVEAVAFAAPNLHPLALWLDVSHLRDKVPRHERLLADVAKLLPPPAPVVAPSIASDVSAPVPAPEPVVVAQPVAVAPAAADAVAAAPQVAPVIRDTVQTPVLVRIKQAIKHVVADTKL